MDPAALLLAPASGPAAPKYHVSLSSAAGDVLIPAGWYTKNQLYERLQSALSPSFKAMPGLSPLSLVDA